MLNNQRIQSTVLRVYALSCDNQRQLKKWFRNWAKIKSETENTVDDE